MAVPKKKISKSKRNKLAIKRAGGKIKDESIQIIVNPCL